MIKIVFSEVESPTTADEATHLDSSSAVRAVNTSKTPSLINIVDQLGSIKSITVVGGESVILKKKSKDTVFASSKTIRIAGVSIY